MAAQFRAAGPDSPQGAGPRTSGRRSVRVTLSSKGHAALVRLASDVGATVEQVAGLMLTDRLDAVLERELLAWIVDRMARIERSLAEARGGRLSDPSTERRSVASGSTSTGLTASASDPRRALHHEIIDVLHDAGEPMSVAEIAAAIRTRDVYHAPRSGNPITGATVNRRISNPQYRSMFERTGRKVIPAPK